MAARNRAGTPKAVSCSTAAGARSWRSTWTRSPVLPRAKPKILLDGPYLPASANLPFYNVSPDGQRFLMRKPVESQASAPTQINIVLNWFEELKAKVPLARW